MKNFFENIIGSICFIFGLLGLIYSFFMAYQAFLYNNTYLYSGISLLTAAVIAAVSIIILSFAAIINLLIKLINQLQK